MIFYFSATGNSKYVAERIADALNDTAVSIEHGQVSYEIPENGILGFVMPTYTWEMPSICRAFLKNTEFKAAAGTYVFEVSTYGVMPGASGADAKHILQSKGIQVDALFGIQMPDTWTPIFDLSDKEKVAERNRAAEQEIGSMIPAIQQRRRGNFQKRRMPYAVRLVTDPVYQSLRLTRHFHVEDSCIGCGLCARKCPVSAIEMKKKKPSWVKKQCTMCLRCLHHCSVFAIQYGSTTKKHGQYRNPHVKV